MVNNEHGVSRIVHHKDYYLRGGDMTVLVENHLYRIHSYFFERESLFFRQKLIAGPSEDGEDRGSSDSNHYTLDDVKSEDFSRFLWVFYNPKYSLYEAPLDVWLSILRLATRWGFNNVKELSVRELEKLEIECVDKISIYHEYSISRLYLIPSYVSVVKRDRPLTFTEGVKLGMETVLRVADARERARQRASESGIRTPSFDDFEDSDVEVLVREVFGLGPPPTPTGASTIPNGSNPSTIQLGQPPRKNNAAASRNGVNGPVNGSGSSKHDASPPVSNSNSTGSTGNTRNQTGGIHNLDREISPASAHSGRGGQQGQKGFARQ